MDFNDTPEEAEFRSRLRQWLRDHSADAAIPDDPAARADAQNAWHQTLYEAGYIGLSFPVEYGGHGLPPIYEAILNDELGHAGAPPIEGVGHLSNALRLFGTDGQRAELLPGLLSGAVRWCQGFSEPEAGSDLASLKTRAELVEVDGRPVFRVNGRKIWTSFAAVADWCFLLCRTEPDAPKHEGISVLLVPMSTTGIEVRPITNAARNREFAEVTFDDVEVAAENLLGERGQGWSIANQLLAYERGPSDINWISRLSTATARPGARRPARPDRELAGDQSSPRRGVRRTARIAGQGAAFVERSTARRPAGAGRVGRQIADGARRSGIRPHHDGPHRQRGAAHRGAGVGHLRVVPRRRNLRRYRADSAQHRRAAGAGLATAVTARVSRSRRSSVRTPLPGRPAGATCPGHRPRRRSWL